MNKPNDLKKTIYQKYEELKVECNGNLQLIYELLADWCYDQASWYQEHPYTLYVPNWKEKIK